MWQLTSYSFTTFPAGTTTCSTAGSTGNTEMGQLRQNSTQLGGYDCEFVKPCPPFLPTRCPICCLLFREPYVVTCCGSNFCHTCIQQLLACNRTCPICRQKGNIGVFPNETLKHSLKQLQYRFTARTEETDVSGKEDWETWNNT